MNWKVFSICLIAFILSDAAHAIVVRGDVPPDTFLADSREYPEVISLLGGRAVGTLIDKQWILTAAHVGQFIAEGNEEAKAIQLVGLEYEVVDIVLHPSWNPGSLGDPNVFDLALLRLNQPVKGICPAPLYQGTDEQGAVVALLGWGRTGDGTSVELLRDGRFRRGENIIDESVPRLRFRFDDPETPGVSSLEAVSGPGDSGGPAFLTVKRRQFLVGVSSFQQDEIAPGIYGVIENYERVSAHTDWINFVISQP